MQHRTQSDLQNADMTSTLTAFKTPEGYILGAGTTVGNGIEGWAPGAIFVDTDSTQAYKNTGTATTASWIGLAAASAASALTTELTDLTFTAPRTPDYALQDVINSSAYGFAAAEEARTFISVVQNMKVRQGEIEAALVTAGILSA